MGSAGITAIYDTPHPQDVELLWVTAKRLGDDFAGTTQLAVANALTKRGWGVTIVAPESAVAKEVVTAQGHRFIGVKRSKITGLGWLSFGRALRRGLREIIAEGGFDVALVEWQGVAGAWRALAATQIPWLVVDRSPPVFRTWAGRMQWWEYRRAWKLAKRANGSVLKSQALADWHRANDRLVEPLTLMEAGVEASRFSVAEKTGLLTLIHHGQLDGERDIEKLVQIGDLLSAKNHDFKMRIAGTGNRLTALQKSARIRDWLDIVGPLPASAIPEFLDSGHIALFPLPDNKVWRLSSPLKVREWAAAGIPMILSDITPHRSVGERDWIRLVAAHAPMDEWTDAVEELMAADLASLGEVARADAESEFDWTQTTAELHQTLSNLVGE